MKAFRNSFLLFLILLSVSIARADTMTLPSELGEAADESFEGCSSITELIVADGIVRLGERAFAECEALQFVQIPASVTEIGTDCFSGTAEAMLIKCPPDSAACEYAIANGLDYDADTVCRAFVLGQTYPGSNRALRGPANDAWAIRSMLSSQSVRPFTVSHRGNLTAQEIIDGTAAAFSDAAPQDISLFYYSGHGTYRGELIGTDSAVVSPADLRSVLDTVPGRKILILDACYSGHWLETASLSEENTSFIDAFIDSFSGKARSGLGEYFILAAAHKYETCVELAITSGSMTKTMGCFTYQFCKGCGWDGVADQKTEKAADSNKDDAVSIAEAFAYASVQANAVNEKQHAQTNAADCTSFAPFR